MIRFAKINNTLILRLLGEMRFTECTALSELLEEIFSDPEVSNVLIDLTQASAIDSTGLGMLAKISNHIKNHHHHKTPIFSTNPDINRTLESMGFDKVFILLRHDPSLPIPDQEVPACSADDTTTAQVILDAHKNLAELNEKNWREFSPIISAIEADLFSGK